jgi:hypothetical protein
MSSTRPWGPFRGWVHNLWVENCEEHFSLAEPVLSEREYFQKFRWWLRREYRHHLQREQKRQSLQALEPRR